MPKKETDEGKWKDIPFLEKVHGHSKTRRFE